MDSARTLTENFAKIPFYYSLENHDQELRTYMTFKTLVLNHEYSSSIAVLDAQYKELNLIMEKRLVNDSLRSKLGHLYNNTT